MSATAELKPDSRGPATGRAPGTRSTASGWRRLLWALLDCFAIAAGVSAAILAVAANHGAYTLARGPVYGLDRRVVVVSGTAASGSGVEIGLPTSSLTPADVTALSNAALVSDAISIAPTVGVKTQVSALTSSTLSDVIGSTDSFDDVLGYSVSSGRFITPTDVATSAQVVVLGTTVANALYVGRNPIGQQVLIDGKSYDVVGVMAPKGYSGSYDQDNLVVMPISTAWQSLTGLVGQPVDQVLIRASSPASAAVVAREATAVMLQRHNIFDPAMADFSVHRQSDLLTAQLQAATAVRRLLEAAALVLLLAGAIQVGVSTRLRLITTGRAPSEPADPTERLVGAVALGFIGAALGIVAAVVLTPTVHRLAAEVPAAHLTIDGIVAGAALGVIASLVAALPGALERGRRSAAAGGGEGQAPTTDA